ncbi:MAG: hypothetical protein U5N86_03900 [Planctomycetota bacterium]|nr:hypothetical protein [Planctomycetota bacterium]
MPAKGVLSFMLILFLANCVSAPKPAHAEGFFFDWRAFHRYNTETLWTHSPVFDRFESGLSARDFCLLRSYNGLGGPWAREVVARAARHDDSLLGKADWRALAAGRQFMRKPPVVGLSSQDVRSLSLLFALDDHGEPRKLLDELNIERFAHGSALAGYLYGMAMHTDVVSTRLAKLTPSLPDELRAFVLYIAAGNPLSNEEFLLSRIEEGNLEEKSIALIGLSRIPPKQREDFSVHARSVAQEMRTSGDTEFLFLICSAVTLAGEEHAYRMLAPLLRDRDTINASLAAVACGACEDARKLPGILKDESLSAVVRGHVLLGAARREDISAELIGERHCDTATQSYESSLLSHWDSAAETAP